MRLKNILVVVIIALLSQMIIAPSALGQSVQFGLSLDGGFPQGDFKQNVESNGIGLEGFIGYNPSQSPLTVGFNFGYISYGSTSRNESFNPNIPEVSVRVGSTNNILTGHFFTRLEPQKGGIRPYAEGLIGLNYLFTESKVSDRDNRNILLDEVIASNTNFNDTAFSTGIGAGIKIKVFDNYGRDTDDQQQWFLDIRAKYIIGGEAEYLREGSLRNINGALEFDTRSSKTNLLTIGVGFIAHIR